MLLLLKKSWHIYLTDHGDFVIVPENILHTNKVKMCEGCNTPLDMDV